MAALADIQIHIYSVLKNGGFGMYREICSRTYRIIYVSAGPKINNLGQVGTHIFTS